MTLKSKYQFWEQDDKVKVGKLNKKVTASSSGNAQKECGNTNIKSHWVRQHQV